MEKIKLITSEELLITMENETTEDSFKTAADNLLVAISDWPTELSEPDELIAELKLQLNDKLTFNNISRFLKTLDVKKDGWKIESLTSVLEIFNLEPNAELEVIIETITKHYKNKSSC